MYSINNNNPILSWDINGLRCCIGEKKFIVVQVFISKINPSNLSYLNKWSPDITIAKCKDGASGTLTTGISLKGAALVSGEINKEIGSISWPGGKGTWDFSLSSINSSLDFKKSEFGIRFQLYINGSIDYARSFFK